MSGGRRLYTCSFTGAQPLPFISAPSYHLGLLPGAAAPEAVWPLKPTIPFLGKGLPALAGGGGGRGWASRVIHLRGRGSRGHTRPGLVGCGGCCSVFPTILGPPSTVFHPSPTPAQAGVPGRVLGRVSRGSCCHKSPPTSVA